MSDCGWNFRGFTSPMGTVSVIGLRSHRMLAVCPLLNETKIANYKGTAKGMEGEGTRRICQALKTNGLSIATFLHDGDSSSFSAVKEVFPEAKELFCINHAGKNLGKSMKASVSVDHWRKVQTYWKEAPPKSAE